MARSTFLRYALTGGAIVALAWAAPAVAQDDEPTAAEAQPAAEAQAEDVEAQGATTSGQGLNDVVVYGQRRSRGAALQDVPIAITAIDAETMQQAFTVDLRDIGRLVPNAQLDGVGTYPGFANFFIRGVGVSTSIRSLDPAINIFQDGMVISYQAGAVLDTFDLESVEVLRGPQGVLFGRNASGGAVVLRSRRPREEFTWHADILLGNSNTFDTHSSVEGALVPGSIAARLSLQTRRSDGYFFNTTDGRFDLIPTNPNQTGVPIQHREGNLPRTRQIIIKPTIVFTISPQTTFTFFGQYQNHDDGGGPSYAYLPRQGTLAPLQTQWGYYPTTGRFETNIAEEGYTQIEAYHGIGELVQQIGPGSLTAIAAYRHVTYNSTLNVGGDPFGIIVFPNARESNSQTSLEARYNVPLTDTLELLVGGFYFDSTTDVREFRIVRSAATTNRTYQVNIWDQDVRSLAAFANFDWTIVPTLTVSAGLRYSYDRKRMHVIPLQSCTSQSFVNCPTNYQNSEESWDDVSPRLVVNFQPNRDMTFYASYSRGYRAGNYNARATSITAAVTPADPETVASYELGAKLEFLDRHVRLNLVGFYQKYDDIQRIVQRLVGQENVQLLFNAAQATVQGVEAEVSVLPFEGFRLDAALGRTDAKYQRFDFLTGLPPGVVPTDLEFDRVPKWTFNLSATYTTSLPTGGDLTGRVSFTTRSHVFTDVNNTPELDQESFDLVDASLAYEHGRWRASVFGRNIFNTFYADIKSRATGYQAFGGSPRTYGLQIGYTF